MFCVTFALCNFRIFESFTFVRVSLQSTHIVGLSVVEMPFTILIPRAYRPAFAYATTRWARAVGRPEYQ